MGDRAAERIEHWKKKLIDLSKRNRLVHFRPSRASTVRVIREQPPEVFRLAAIERATLSFRPFQDEEQETTAVYRPYTDADLEPGHRDRVLQSDLDEESLDPVLLNLYRKAVAIHEDHGYNVLFLALGFLDWDEPASGERLRSPIVLVPVDLLRKSAAAPFRLKGREEEPVLNPALVQVLKAQFGVEVPPLPDDIEEFQPRAFYDAFAQAVSAIPKAEVTTSIYLGLFSFTKFVMYKDLETHTAAFAANPLVRTIAGDAQAAAALPREPVPAGRDLDSLDPRKVFQIMDADSSQQEAIEAVKRGRSLVIEGPPGTGKSQTISNVIAECLLAGKRVLFVSEKMAALRVVYDRLARAGLGDFCLELHSHKANKRAVISELGRVLDLARARTAVGEDLLPQLARTRDDLNAYVRELKDPVAPLGVSPYEAFGIQARHEKTPEVPVFLKGAGAWTKEKLEANRARIAALARTRGAVEPTDRHPWRGCGITDASYERQLEIRKRIDEFLKQHAEFWRLLHELAAELEAPPRPTVVHDWMLIGLARLLFDSPKPEPALLDDPRWIAPGGVEGLKIIGSVTEYVAARDALLPRYDSAILDAEVEPLHAWWLRHGDSLLRFIRPTFWKARGLLKRLRKTDAPDGDALKDLDFAVKARRAAREIDKADGTLFGSRWKGLDSSPQELYALHHFLSEFGARVRAGIVSGKIRRLAATGMPSRPLPDVKAYEDARKSLQASVGAKLAESPDAAEPHFQDAARRSEAMRDGMERLAEWTRYQAALREASIPELVDFAGGLDAVPPGQIEAAFERQFFRSWLEEVLSQRPRLAKFDGLEHDRLVATFAELDRRVIELNRKRARAELLGRLPDPSWEASPGSDLGLLQREVRKKRCHAPLRKLFSAIPRTLVRVKPCLMMSPLSVAQFLEPTAEPFDLVVFDEASQISPEDAVGTIARARQVVVVGDPKQLPPTPFFHVEAPDGEDAGEAEIAEGDLESVLDECAAIFPERRMLRWHYRSRDEDLIAFSNRAYYDGRLVTFPSPARAAGRPAVEFVHVPDGVYDRGGTGMNRVEAERVAKAVFEQLKARPDKSVGVGAFSIKQQQAIEDALERLRRADASLEARFDPARDEFCFVKNLETIQGDERDVIFLSIGYGKDAAGGMSVNFGPLNQEGGARRLNVLVTRAREKIFVFSSIQPEDIDLSRTESVGVRNFRKYLEYAKRGPEALAGEAPVEPPGGIERAIEEALTARGLAVERGVGRSEYRLDLAVKEGDRRVLGVECDGPAYQGGATARDRDRLRRQVLESLGWRLHRLWSPAFFRQPQRELARIVEEVERAKAGRPPVQAEVRIEAAAPAAIASTGPEVTSYRLAAVKFLGHAEEFFAVPVDRVAEVLGTVVSCEGPIHVDEAARRVAAHWEITRIAPRVFDVIQSASWRCQKADRFEQRGTFLWPAGMAEAPVRGRETDGAPRDAELIAPEEIAQATLLVLAKEFRVREDELTDRAARILGFTRTGPKVRESVAAALAILRREGKVTDGEWIERVKA